MLKYTCLTLCCCFVSISFALPSDQNKALTLSADHSQVNYKTNEAVNTGHVKINEGTSHLDGDKVITFRNKQHKISKMVAFGTLAHYHTLLALNTPILYTAANVITYLPLQHLIILQGNAHAKRGPNSISSDKLVYHTDNEVLDADSQSPNLTHAMVYNAQKTKGTQTASSHE